MLISFLRFIKMNRKASIPIRFHFPIMEKGMVTRHGIIIIIIWITGI